ncbi:MAG: hypothetical protein MRZ79_13535 [Bacteroidia bacterium]|nr:hypothetical protein [Bacteroidia bacterium]
METEKVFYCASRTFPVYYKVNPKSGIIESIKDWSEYPKAIDRFNYSAVFAREISHTCKAISREEYEQKREFVSTYMNLNQSAS